MKIGIIGALKVEVDALLELVESYQKIDLFQHIFYISSINQHELVIVQSGVGKVAASIATTLLITQFNVNSVINIGTAGGLVVTQNPLDIVIANHVIQHDFDTSYVDGDAGVGLVYQADYLLSEKVQQAFQKIKSECMLYTGDIISGDQFIGDIKKVESLIKNYPTAIACDMESGAIGQVCSIFDVPFVIVRSLSDIAYHDNSANEFQENVKITSMRSAKMVQVLLNE